MHSSNVSGALCDSHVHVVGDPSHYPLAGTRTYIPGLAHLSTLERLAAPLGIGRFVIVQPSFYGSDNSLLLEALRELEGRGRGVAVVAPASVSLPDLDKLTATGVRGLRINLYSGPSAGHEDALAGAFHAVAALARDQDWHIEVIAPLATLVDAAELLATSPVPVVIDHYGLHGATAPDTPSARKLIASLRLPHVWMKLSAPYRVGADELAVHPDPGWLAPILEACADRCVWGSDWPHTPPHGAQTGADRPVPYRALDYRALFEGFREAVSSDGLAERILRDNPAKLYGFEEP